MGKIEEGFSEVRILAREVENAGCFLHRSINRRRVALSERGQGATVLGAGSVGVLLPLLAALIVSGEPASVISGRRVDFLEVFQVFLASFATRAQTPQGGDVPGNLLKGV
jgi:hypothetical protein